MYNIIYTLYILFFIYTSSFSDIINSDSDINMKLEIIKPILNLSNPYSIPVSINERNNINKCSFLNHYNKNANCEIEKYEHILVQKYINNNAKVLELGARYGTTSCEITTKLNNSGFLISVEVDPSVWDILSYNQRNHNCNFYILHGVIGNINVEIYGNGYGTKAIPITEI